MTVRGVYEPLRAFLGAGTVTPLTLSFEQIEMILGSKLPKTARERVQWWANEDPSKTQHTQSLTWTSAGLKAKPDLAYQTVTFSR